MGWWNPVEEAGNDAGLDGKRLSYDPAGAAVKDLRRRFGSTPQSTYATDTFAELTRQQYADYVSNIVPLENRLIDYATDPSVVGNAVTRAQGLVNTSFDRQAAANQERIRGLGLTLDADEQAAMTRSTDLARGLAEVDAMNSARDQTMARRASILGSPTPQVAQMMGPK